MQHDVLCDLICFSVKKDLDPNHKSLLKNDLNQNRKSQEII